MRLSTALFDPYVAILDSKRFELSAHDDTALALQDAYASVIAPEDGKYVIEVRESGKVVRRIYHPQEKAEYWAAQFAAIWTERDADTASLEKSMRRPGLKNGLCCMAGTSSGHSPASAMRQP